MSVRTVILAFGNLANSRYSLGCLIAAVLGCSTAIAADPSDIARIVENVELPTMRKSVNPLLALSETRQFLRKAGEKRGYGKEWDSKAEEWIRIEEMLVAAILTAPRREPELVKPLVTVSQCLADLSHEERGAIAHLLESNEWRSKVAELDRIGAIFAMLHVEDKSLRTESAEIIKTFKSKTAIERTELEIPEKYRLQLVTPASQACMSAIFARIMENNGPRSLSNDVKEHTLIDFGSFEARNKHLAINWLLSASRSGNRARATELLNNGIDINSLGVGEYKGMHVLHMLAEGSSQDENIDLGSLLIQRGADVNVRDEVGATPLVKAVGRNRRKLVEFFLDKGANINIAARYGSPLRLALNRGNVPLAEYLVSRGASAELNEHGETLLHSAVQEGQAKSVDWLLARGIDVAKQSAGGGYMAIHAATTRSTDEMIRKLAAAGANLNARDSSGRTPLHFAVQQVAYLDGRGPKLSSALIDLGADVTLSDNDGLTPLHKAVEGWSEQERKTLGDRLSIVKKLIDRGAKVNARSSQGETPLHLAYLPELVQALVDAGADINALDDRKRSPLRSACISKKRYAVVSKLRALGAKDEECN